MSRYGQQFGPDFTFLGVPMCDLDDPASYDGADVVILGAPFDGGTSHRPGARFGPMAIRMQDYLPHDGSRPSLALRTDGLQDLKVFDAGDVEMYSGDIEVALPALEAAVEKVTRAGAIPVTLGGDHSVTFPDAKGVANVLGHGRVSMIHFDAHADTGDIEFGSLWGHGQPMRRLIESGALRGDRFLQVGLRGYWPPPDTLDWMAGQKMRSYEMTEIVHRGLDECLSEAFVIAMDDCDGVFLSVDIDVCDPGHAPGTGTPEPGGLSARAIARRGPADLPRAPRGRGGRRRGVTAVRPRRHHRSPGQPRRAGVAQSPSRVAAATSGTARPGTRRVPSSTGERACTRSTRQTEQMVRSVLAYAENRLRMDPVPLDQAFLSAEQLTQRLAGVITDTPRQPDEVLGYYSSVIAPSVISADSPRFLGFIPAAPTKASLLFDMLVSCASIQGISWLEASGAIAAENTVLGLIAKEAGLPTDAGGCFVSGGSAGNLSALAVARETAKKRDGDPRRRYRVVVGSDAHSSIVNTLKLLEMDALLVETPDHRLTREAVEKALAQEEDLHDVAAVASTSGTTNAGIIDDLRGVGTLARERGWWFHVDGAYGGAGMFVPDLKPKYDGLELADSFILDPHKWLFTPFDCCALLYRDPALARETHTQDASYLDVIRDGTVGVAQEWNPTDYAYHLTRRARGLPLWFSLAVHGLDAYRSSHRGRGAASPRDRRPDQVRAAPRAGARARPGHRAVPPARVGARRLRPLGASPARRPGRLHPAEQVGGRDGRPVRLPAPRHQPGRGARGARPHALRCGRRVSRRVVRHHSRRVSRRVSRRGTPARTCRPRRSA